MTQVAAVITCFAALFLGTRGKDDSRKYLDQDLNAKNYT
jgi:hypothetical protein